MSWRASRTLSRKPVADRPGRIFTASVDRTRQSLTEGARPTGREAFRVGTSPSHLRSASPRRRTRPFDPPDKTTMFAVRLQRALARPAAATRAQRAPAARRVVAARASADAETTGAKVRQAATVALLSATVAFGHPGYANAGLFGGGDKMNKYGEDATARYMREMEEARCVG